MELASAKLIAASLCMVGLLGAGIGLGNIFATFLNAIARNPSAHNEMFKVSLIGAAFTEAIALFAIVVALIILFAF